MNVVWLFCRVKPTVDLKVSAMFRSLRRSNQKACSPVIGATGPGVVSLLLFLAACSSGVQAQTPAQLSIIGASRVRLGGHVQYSALVNGASGAAVVWSVNGVVGGTSATGPISDSGIYSPASTIVAGHAVTISAATETEPVSSASLSTKVLNQLPIIHWGSVTQTAPGSSFLLNLLGAGFVSASQLQIAGANVATIVISSTEIQSTISLPAGTTTVSVGVLNPNADQSAPVTQQLSVQAALSAPGSFAYAGSPLVSTLAPATPSAPISDRFFGMTVYFLTPNSLYPAPNMTPFPSFPVSTFRFWDVVYWSMIDNYEGQSNYTKMDNSIAIAQKNGVSDFIFTFGNVPAWASTNPTDPCADGWGPGTCAPPNMDAFDSFATQLVQRYCGTVKYYEPWNEPSNKEFWDGTNAQLLTIAQHTYQIAKNPANCGCTNGVCSPNGGVNPNQVLLPPVAILTPADYAWLDSYLASAGTSYPYADIVAFHGYVWSGYAPEEIVSGVQLLKQTLAKYGLSKLPLWNTEVSFETDTNNSDQNQASWLMRYHATQAALGIPRVIWYAYDNCTWGTLWSSPLCSATQGPADPVSQLTVAGAAYATIEKWFTGATLTQCQQYQNGLWACELQRSGGNYDAWMLWSNSGTSISVPIPDSFGLAVYRDSLNNVMTLPAQITVTQMPVLLENYDL